MTAGLGGTHTLGSPWMSVWGALLSENGTPPHGDCILARTASRPRCHSGPRAGQRAPPAPRRPAGACRSQVTNRTCRSVCLRLWSPASEGLSGLVLLPGGLGRVSGGRCCLRPSVLGGLREMPAGVSAAVRAAWVPRRRLGAPSCGREVLVLHTGGLDAFLTPSASIGSFILPARWSAPLSPLSCKLPWVWWVTKDWRAVVLWTLEIPSLWSRVHQKDSHKWGFMFSGG